MFNLPQNTELGKILVDRVFVFYDIPRLFTCKSSTHEMYLVLSIDETIGLNSYRYEWLYLKLSHSRYDELLRQKIDLITAFRNPENNIVYKLVEEKRSDSEIITEVEALNPNNITPDMLPEPNEYLTQTPETSTEVALDEVAENIMKSAHEYDNSRVVVINANRSFRTVQGYESHRKRGSSRVHRPSYQVVGEINVAGDTTSVKPKSNSKSTSKHKPRTPLRSKT